MTAQLRLLPRQAPTIERASVPIEQIDGWQQAQPDRELIELVRELGVLQPVLLTPTRGGRFSLVDGRRRTKTVAILAQQQPDQTPTEVDAYILTDRDASALPVRAGLTLALHSSRSDSPASELAAIEAIIKAAGDEDAAVTIKQIAAQTEMPAQTVQRRLRLQRLIAPLRAAFDHGTITVSVAEAAARLTADRQAQLAEQLSTTGRLTATTVRDVARTQTVHAVDALPDAVFTEMAAPWQTTVLGHLEAAGAAIPADANAALTRAVRAALRLLGA